MSKSGGISTGEKILANSTYFSTRDCVNDKSCDASPPEALVFFIPNYAEKCRDYGYFFEKASERLGLTFVASD